jgi:hypothetical protein
MRKLRAREPERGGGVPAIALTAYARAEDANPALDARIPATYLEAG